jgi:RNA polymerase sigma-70 factor (ECF subfamily)
MIEETDPLQALIARLNDGDVAAAERAFAEYEPYLRMAVRRHLSGPLRSKLDSMDVVQSVWANILVDVGSSGRRFRDVAHLRAFLVRVARNRLIDHQRHHHRALECEQPLEVTPAHDVTSSRQPRPSETLAGEELWERMLAHCPPRHQELLQLRRQGFTVAEIAERIGLHEGSVRRILYDLARRLAPGVRKDSEEGVTV